MFVYKCFAVKAMHACMHVAKYSKHVCGCCLPFYLLCNITMFTPIFSLHLLLLLDFLLLSYRVPTSNHVFYLFFFSSTDYNLIDQLTTGTYSTMATASFIIDYFIIIDDFNDLR